MLALAIAPSETPQIILKSGIKRLGQLDLIHVAMRFWFPLFNRRLD